MNELEMDTAAMVLSILFMQKKIIIIFEKSCRKIWWFEKDIVSLYQEIKTDMAHNSSRAFYFRRKGISFDYITTIETKKYGNIDVCGCYNCRWCKWELILFSQKYNNECVGSFIYRSVKNPTDADLKIYVYRYMREYIAELKK